MKEGDSSNGAEDMIRDLIEGQDAVARSCRAAMALADEANDQPTVDIMVQRLQIHEKNAWMMRSLLESGGKEKSKKK
jgi:starvation-inducible DNA-binding protein